MKTHKVRLIFFLLAVILLCFTCPALGAAESTVKLPILMYHQMNPDSSAWGPFTISPEMFEADLRYLQAHGYTSITAKELMAYTRGEFTMPPKPVLLTFDDGYESFREYALPLLQKYGMTAVMSVVGVFSDAHTEEEDHNIAYSYFSWPGLANLSQFSAVELAAHTYDMHWLKDRQGCRIQKGEGLEDYRTAFGGDIDQLEARFQTYIGQTPTVFAYPFGFYCKEARAILQSKGYQVLFTCDQKVNYLTGRPEERLNRGRYNRASTMSCEQIFQKME